MYEPSFIAMLSIDEQHLQALPGTPTRNETRTHETATLPKSSTPWSGDHLGKYQVVSIISKELDSNFLLSAPLFLLYPI